MLRMESHHSDTSLNFSERDLPAWDKLWNANYSSAGRLNLGENSSEADYTTPIGDKEVAAKAAVAFVVSSSRKGIVSLCADVANLMRAKRSLEDRIAQISKENEGLRLISDERESLMGSSVSRCKQMDTSSSIKGRNDSVCSHHSAAYSIGQPPADRLQEADGAAHDNPSAIPETAHHMSQSNGQSSTNHPAGSHQMAGGERGFVPVTPAKRASPRIDNEVIIHPVPSSSSEETALHTNSDNVTRAEVYVLPASATTSPPPTRHWTRGDGWERRRSPSLSSSERGSNRSLELSSVDERQSRISIPTLSQKLHKTVLVNNKLTEELYAARATIEKLQRQVRDFRGFCKTNSSSNSQPMQKTASVTDISLTQQKYIPDREFSPPGALSTCHICTEAHRTSSINGVTTQPQFKHDAITLFTSENMLVSLDDSVLTRNNQCGAVRYIGHLDGFASSCLFVGLQLADRVPGGFDGTFNSKSYFSCPEGCGIFIQAADIVNVLSKKQASVLHKTKRNPVVAGAAAAALVSAAVTADSLGSSSNSGSSGGVARRFRKSAASIRHTHSHKKISLPEGCPPTHSIPGLRQSGANASHQSSSTTVISAMATSHAGYSHSSHREGDLPEGYV